MMMMTLMTVTELTRGIMTCTTTTVASNKKAAIMVIII
jgi:hypothetical protein